MANFVLIISQLFEAKDSGLSKKRNYSEYTPAVSRLTLSLKSLLTMVLSEHYVRNRFLKQLQLPNLDY